jgi:hypothetical protein
MLGRLIDEFDSPEEECTRNIHPELAAARAIGIGFPKPPVRSDKTDG